VFGLIVAIIAMISHSAYTHFIDKFTADIEKNCSRLISEIVEQSETE
jgi:biopolymer transport protein ExbB